MKGGCGTKLENQLGPRCGEPLGVENLKEKHSAQLYRTHFALLFEGNVLLSLIYANK